LCPWLIRRFIDPQVRLNMSRREADHRLSHRVSSAPPPGIVIPRQKFVTLSQDAPIAQQSAPTMTSDFLSFHHVVLLWTGLVIGLAMILIVIAMGVGDR
jgi:hypothetical protein